MRWRVYYGDGSTFSGDDSNPWDAPATDVQAIAVEMVEGEHRVIHSKDAYYWRNNGWFACDMLGFWDYMLMHKGPKAVLFGRSMARGDDFFKLVKRAQAEGLG